MPTVATIGYEGSALADVLATLRNAGIVTLIDVRQVPSSRKPGFSKHKLRATLEAQGIRYVHLIGLGTPKAGREAARRGDRSRFRRVYDRQLATPEARADLATAGDLATDDGACLLCYERDPAVCHRTIVAELLAGEQGFTIRHLLVEGGVAGLISPGD